MALSKATTTSCVSAPSSTFQLHNGHADAIYSLDFSPCHRFLASGGFDRQIVLWEMDPKGEQDSDVEDGDAEDEKEEQDHNQKSKGPK